MGERVKSRVKRTTSNQSVTLGPETYVKFELAFDVLLIKETKKQKDTPSKVMIIGYSLIGQDQSQLLLISYLQSFNHNP